MTIWARYGFRSQASNCLPPFPYRGHYWQQYPVEAPENSKGDERHGPSVCTTQRTCGICYSDKETSEFPPESDMMAHCGRKLRNVCKRCIAAHIKAQLDDARPTDELKCADCGAKIGPGFVREFADPEVFERYDHLQLRQLLAKDPDFHECLGPGCTSGQFVVLEEGDRPRMTCNVCHYQQCLRHNIRWHADMSCEEYDKTNPQQREEMEASEALIRNSSQFNYCPSCNCALEKKEGCDHITCKQCRHEFCWQCLSPYVDILSPQAWKGHKEGCKYHPGGLAANALHNMDVRAQPRQPLHLPQPNPRLPQPILCGPVLQPLSFPRPIVCGPVARGEPYRREVREREAVPIAVPPHLATWTRIHRRDTIETARAVRNVPNEPLEPTDWFPDGIPWVRPPPPWFEEQPDVPNSQGQRHHEGRDPANATLLPLDPPLFPDEATMAAANEPGELLHEAEEYDDIRRFQ